MSFCFFRNRVLVHETMNQNKMIWTGEEAYLRHSQESAIMNIFHSNFKTKCTVASPNFLITLSLPESETRR